MVATNAPVPGPASLAPLPSGRPLEELGRSLLCPLLQWDVSGSSLRAQMGVTSEKGTW